MSNPYKKDVHNLRLIDVYRILSLYSVSSHAVGHAIKKLLCAGQRGAKTYEQDIREAIASLNRELQMLAEDEGKRSYSSSIKELEDKLEAIGAGGVTSVRLMGEK